MKRTYFLILFLSFIFMGVEAQDYAAFDVKGPVRKIEYSAPDCYEFTFLCWGNQVYEFTQKGFCKRFLKYRRDAQKRVTSEEWGCDLCDHQVEEWYYDKQGRLYWISSCTEESFEHYRYMLTFFYDKAGNMNRVRMRMDREPFEFYIDFRIKVLERDSKGNWIRREFLELWNKDQEMMGRKEPRVYIESRKIYYY